MPWASTDDERRALELEIRSVVGSSFARVAYLEPATTEMAEPWTDAGFDVAGVGLEFTTAEGTLVSAVWQMDGYNEGMSFGRGNGASRHARYDLRRLDVTHTARWRPRLGHRVAEIGVGWHLPNEGSAEAVWAVRLEFEAGPEILIALGRSGNAGAIEYQPDEVVVVFDENLARSYQIPAQTRSAWAK